LHIIEVSSPVQGNQPFSKKQVEIQFAAESNADFPIAMQSSAEHGVIFMVTKQGFVQMFDVETGVCIYVLRVSTETIFITAEHQALNGFLGINRESSIGSPLFRKIYSRKGEYSVTTRFPIDLHNS
jgi:clathrin heavy chain